MNLAYKAQNLAYAPPPSKRNVFANANFEIFEGDFVGILGVNGSGKSTLLKLLAGQILPSYGQLVRSEIKGHGNLAYLTQDFKYPSSLSVKEYLRFHAYHFKNYQIDLEKNYCNLFGIDENTQFGSMSTGEKIKAQLVAILSSRCPIIILDEVTAVLDPFARKILYSELESLNQLAHTIILATNINQELENRINRLILVKNHTINTYTYQEMKNVLKEFQ